jgi:hypothetical protein
VIALMPSLPSPCSVACVTIGHPRFGTAILLNETRSDSTWLVAAVVQYMILKEVMSASQHGGLARVTPNGSSLLPPSESARAGRLLHFLRGAERTRVAGLGDARSRVVMLPRGFFGASGRLTRRTP